MRSVFGAPLRSAASATFLDFGLVARGLPSRELSERDTAGRLGLTSAEFKQREHAHEVAVSSRIRAMPFLWIAVGDPPGPGSIRALIERNAIALLSNYGKTALDPPSADWLGRASGRARVRESGLWNNSHVDESYDRAFLDALAAAVRITGEISVS